jgi:hypothetical protein
MIQLIIEEENPMTRSNDSLQCGTVARTDSTIYGVPFWRAGREIVDNKDGFQVRVYYCRSDRGAFNRTYRQICDSLTIE